MSLEAAKSLLKKAQVLNDPELLELANSLLSQVTVYNFRCDSCGHEFSSNKIKKSCPQCKKRKISQVIQEETIATPQKQEVKGQPKITGRMPINKWYNHFVDDGSLAKEDKKFDEKYKSYFKVSERVRPEAENITVKCQRCMKPFELSPTLYSLASQCQSNYFLCNSCGTNR